jgi:hypothetical protein
VKLRSSATIRNADNTLSSSRTIHEWYSQTLVDFSGYQTCLALATLNVQGNRHEGLDRYE